MSFKGLTSSSQEKRAERQKSLEPSFKLVMIGDSGVGKSCLLEKLLDLSSTNAFISTIGVDVRTHVINVNGHAFKLQVWDTGGQQRYRPVLSSCYRNVHGIIMVFDVTNVKSFANLPQWIKEVKEFAPNQGGVPKLLIGNKSDLEDRREVTPEIAEAFAKENSMSYIETSAIATTNIREAFMALLQSNND